jgi:hypothetical protein
MPAIELLSPQKAMPAIEIDPEAYGDEGQDLGQQAEEAFRHHRLLYTGIAADDVDEAEPDTDLTRILDSLDQIALLPDRWDSYSAPAPSIVAVQNAKLLVNEADRFDMLPIRVEPSAMGGVGVTFSSGSREVVIEFYNKGSAHALFADDLTGDMRTEPVSTDLTGYQNFLSEVRTHFHDK